MSLEKPQLHMVWPFRRLLRCPASAIAAGYTIRTYQLGDEEAFLRLMSLMDFDPWDEAKLEYNKNKVIPEGWFFVTDASDQIVATAMCLHNYTGHSPFTGDVGWVACHPDHRGNHLGLSLCGQVTDRFLAAGYTLIQLHTEHYRLPAIKTYLRLGYVPHLAADGAAGLWQAVCTRLDWPFDPDRWQA
jgi:mycothiol synthase